MSVNCIRCGINRRTGTDLYCDDCRGKRPSQCAFCGEVTLYSTKEEFAELASRHVLTCEKHPLRAFVLNQAMLLSTIKGCIGALDRLLGDTDLPEDDRPEVLVMRAAQEVVDSVERPAAGMAAKSGC